jgi:hypothetical protein
MSSLAMVFSTLRSEVAPFVAAAEEPHAELLALVWGPQFDRRQARNLVACVPPQSAPGLRRALLEAADRFDRLPAGRQQRLRRLILQHRGRWENSRHAPHPAD